MESWRELGAMEKQSAYLVQISANISMSIDLCGYFLIFVGCILSHDASQIIVTLPFLICGNLIHC